MKKLQILPFINIQICSSITCSVQLNGFICNFFQNVPVSIQMIRTLLFINRFLQVWYQNVEDIHLLSIICFYFVLYEAFL